MTQTIEVPKFTVTGVVIETPPTTPGLWFLSCGENDSTFEPTAVFYDPKGVLVVEDLSLGITPVDYFHFGLTAPKWLRQK